MLSVVTSSGCQKMASPHVTVIVLNWNGWRETLPCLDSLAVQKYQNMSIIVVDYASKDDSKNRIVAWPGNAGKTWVKRQFSIDNGVGGGAGRVGLCIGDFFYMVCGV